MNEYMIGYTAVGSLIGLSIGCLLYMLGGRDGKWIRRYLGSAVIAFTVMLCAIIMGKFNWWLSLLYVPLALGFSLGYGADVVWKKIMKRTIFAVTIVSAGLICCFSMNGNSWAIFPLHFLIGMGSVYLGVCNPIQAASEEVFVCALLNICLMMYPFIA